jgi:hypothetical protein
MSVCRQVSEEWIPYFYRTSPWAHLYKSLELMEHVLCLKETSADSKQAPQPSSAVA